MTVSPSESLEITIGAIQRGRLINSFEPVTIETSRGELRLRHYPAPDAETAVIFIGNRGGWSSPCGGRLFPRLAEQFADAGTAALQLRYRCPGALEESVLDVLAGMHFLVAEGVRRFGLLGHGFGGPVAAQAAANGEGVRALVTLATQSQELDAVRALPDGCACLFVHGAEDRVNPPSCSRFGYKIARDPRYLRIFGGAGHELSEVADALAQELRDWLLAELRDS